MNSLAASLLLLLPSADPADAVQADFVIRGATVFDGSGGDKTVADVAIRGDRIVAIGTFKAAGEPRIIDGKGLVAAPGFIDLHSHSDFPITRAATRGNINYLMQGCTSVLTGNCGGGQLDVDKYLGQIENAGAGTNVLPLIPHGALRRKVMGNAARPPSPAELAQMKTLAGELMRAGAWGMSTGLIYLPSGHADTAELVELSKVLAEHDGLYASHMRNEGSQVLEAIEEALQIGRQSKARVHISHFKVSGPHAWGLARDAVEAVSAARAKGQIVTADQYPYTASSTSLAAMAIPSAFRGMSDLYKLAAEPERGADLRRGIQQALDLRGGGARLFVASYKTNRAWQGKNLVDIAKQEGIEVLELVLRIQKNGGAQMINFGMSEEEVRLIMQQKFVATASDGSAQDIKAETQPHPRSYGTFPRKIGHYAIDGKIISLAHAIRSASGLPADILKLPKRGYLKQGYFADVVVFAPAEFRDTATFEEPHQYAAGVRYLFVNGKLAIDEGKFTGQLHGRALRHESALAAE